MTPVTLNSGTLQETSVPAPSPKPGAPAGSVGGSSVQESGQPADSVQLSPAALRETGLTGRVALNEKAGNLSGDQAQQLYGQIASIHSQIATDRQADGGTLSSTDAQAIQQLQSQLNQTIYSDAHNGTAPPSNPNVTQAGEREAVEAGRIVLNEKAGNVTTAQAQQLGSQLATIHQQIAADEQANGGPLNPADAQAINQLQNQFSQQIYEAAHGGATPGQSGGTA